MMKSIYIILLMMISATACHNDKQEENKTQNDDHLITDNFDQDLWLTKEGQDYPFREEMIDAVLYNDTIRSLNKIQLIDLLGEASYIRDDHLYYRISENRIGTWKLKTKTLVIKLADDETVEWIKMHG